MVTAGAFMLPPAGDGVSGEGGRVVGYPGKHRTAVGQPIVDAVRDGNANSICAEVVIVHAHRIEVPFGAVVPEVAGQFPLLGVALMMGRPWRWKRARKAAMYSNCRFLSGLD